MAGNDLPFDGSVRAVRDDPTVQRPSVKTPSLPHEPGPAGQIWHIGGKNNWWRSNCIGTGCDYYAIESHQEAARRRVRQHGHDKARAYQQ